MEFRREQNIYYASDSGYWPAAAGRAAGSARLAARFAQHVRARSLALRDADGKSAFAVALRSQRRSIRPYRAAASDSRNGLP